MLTKPFRPPGSALQAVGAVARLSTRIRAWFGGGRQDLADEGAQSGFLPAQARSRDRHDANPHDVIDLQGNDGAWQQGYSEPAYGLEGTLGVYHLGKSYRSRQVVQDVSLVVRRGEAVGLLGPNGAGKTTVFYMITGLVRPDKGAIELDGHDIAHLPMYRRARLGIGYMPQGRRVFPSLTVREHMQVTAHARPGSPWTFERMLELFPNLGERLEQSGAKLSGGEQTMLAAGRALVANPDLLLMDEPTEGLSPLMVRELGKLVGVLKDTGTPVLLVEQQLAFVLKYADRVYILSKGQVVHHCKPSELADDHDIKARYLGV